MQWAQSRSNQCRSFESRSESEERKAKREGDCSYFLLGDAMARGVLCNRRSGEWIGYGYYLAQSCLDYISASASVLLHSLHLFLSLPLLHPPSPLSCLTKSPPLASCYLYCRSKNYRIIIPIPSSISQPSNIVYFSSLSDILKFSLIDVLDFVFSRAFPHRLGHFETRSQKVVIGDQSRTGTVPIQTQFGKGEYTLSLQTAGL